MRFCDLRQLEVINARDCTRLGFVSDLIFDKCTGQICDIIVPGPSKFCGCIGREADFIIPFCKIQCIGHDVILVNFHPEHDKHDKKKTNEKD